MKRLFCILLVGILCLTGCGKGNHETVSIDVYTVDDRREYITRTSTEVIPQDDPLLLYVSSMVEANENLFPEGTSVLSVKVEQGVATVDVTKEIKSVTEEDFLFINELCALAISQGERQQGDKIAKMNLLCEGEPLSGYFQYPYVTRLVDQAAQTNFPIWMLHLYFPNKDNTKLVREYRLVPAGEEAKQLITNEMRRGTENPADKNNVFPYNAQALNLSFEEDTYYLDYSKEFVTECIPGLENMLVQAMVACYSEFAYINQVQLSVEGNKDVTFGGFSFAQPLTVDESYFADPQTYFQQK